MRDPAFGFGWRSMTKDPPPSGVSILGFVRGEIEQVDGSTWSYSGVIIYGSVQKRRMFSFDDGETPPTPLHNVPLWSYTPLPTDEEVDNA